MTTVNTIDRVLTRLITSFLGVGQQFMWMSISLLKHHSLPPTTAENVSGNRGGRLWCFVDQYPGFCFILPGLMSI